MPKLDSHAQFGALIVLEYLSDLFTVSGKETYTQAEILRILNCVTNDPDLIDPKAVIAYQEATADIR